jgi:ParB-like chromosome segregation protein Spo0J
VRPENRQPRLLPLPDALRIDGQPVPAYADLVAELLDLGRSLQRRQLQPILVYPGTSELFPDVRYLILIGHRRWTASILVGIETINAVVVAPPDALQRYGTSLGAAPYEAGVG